MRDRKVSNFENEIICTREISKDKFNKLGG